MFQLWTGQGYKSELCSMISNHEAQSVKALWSQDQIRSQDKYPCHISVLWLFPVEVCAAVPLSPYLKRSSCLRRLARSRCSPSVSLYISLRWITMHPLLQTLQQSRLGAKKGNFLFVYALLHITALKKKKTCFITKRRWSLYKRKRMWCPSASPSEWS